ncbi:MAG: hypothetical protein ABGY11_16045 [Candidatus Thioglobus sp.]|jgi:antitoxin component YwqK of YwqJK toxin-antitoxin module
MFNLFSRKPQTPDRKLKSYNNPDGTKRQVVLLQQGNISTKLQETIYFKNGERSYDFVRNGESESSSSREKTWYENGQMKSNLHIEKDYGNGYLTTWYKNGQKKFEGCSAFYDSSSSGSDNTPKRLKFYGPQTRWHRNGKVQMQINLANGRLDGVWTEWYENGNRSFECYFPGSEIPESFKTTICHDSYCNGYGPCLAGCSKHSEAIRDKFHHFDTDHFPEGWDKHFNEDGVIIQRREQYKNSNEIIITTYHPNGQEKEKKSI